MSYYTEAGLKKLGERMRFERKQRSLTTRELAYLVGERTAHTTIDRLEQGLFEEPKPNTLAKIAPHLDMTVEEMLAIASERDVKKRTCAEAMPLLNEMPVAELQKLHLEIQKYLLKVEKLEKNATD